MRQYFLKKPVFLTFERDGNTRVEPITGIWCREMAEDEEQEVNLPELRGFCDLIEQDDDDAVAWAVELSRHDVTEGVNSAFYGAKWAADRWFDALRKDGEATETRTLDFKRFQDPEWREKFLDPLNEFVKALP